jgi:hypothetical protein
MIFPISFSSSFFKLSFTLIFSTSFVFLRYLIQEKLAKIMFIFGFLNIFGSL